MLASPIPSPENTVPVDALPYFPGCPHVVAAREQLSRAFTAAGLAASWTEHDVTADARVRGYGSPTVLVDGCDVAGTGSAEGASCRVYAGSAVLGVPPLEAIVAALRGAPGKWSCAVRTNISFTTIPASLLAPAERGHRSDLLGLAGARVEHLTDNPVSDVVEMGVELAVDGVEVRPQRLVHEPLRDLEHDGLPVLPAAAVGLESVATGEGVEDLPRPRVRDGELVLDRWVSGGEFGEPGKDPLLRLGGRDALASSRGTGVKRLDQAQLLDQLGLVHRGRMELRPGVEVKRDRHAPSWGPRYVVACTIDPTVRFLRHEAAVGGRQRAQPAVRDAGGPGVGLASRPPAWR